MDFLEHFDSARVGTAAHRATKQQELILSSGLINRESIYNFLQDLHIRVHDSKKPTTSLTKDELLASITPDCPASIHSTYLSSHDGELWSEAPACFVVWAEDSELNIPASALILMLCEH